jgi:hypothetical protein
MKPSYRYYTADKGARFRSGQKELVLHKNDIFRLALYEGRPSVIKDGVVYGVNKRLVKELKDRSLAAAVGDSFKEQVEFLNVHGLDIEEALVKNTASIITALKGSEVRSFFKDETICIAFNTVYDRRPESIVVVYQMTKTSISVGAYCSSKEAVEGWSATPLLQRSFSKFAKYLTTKYGIETDKPKSHTATYGNVRVAGKPFSGRVFSYSSNWYV